MTAKEEVPSVSTLRLQTKSKFTPKVHNSSHTLNDGERTKLSSLSEQKSFKEMTFMSTIQASPSSSPSSLPPSNFFIGNDSLSMARDAAITFEDLLKPILNSVTILEESNVDSSMPHSSASTFDLTRSSQVKKSTKKNSSLLTSSSSLHHNAANESSSSSTFIKMSDFLKDSGQGIPMNSNGNGRGENETLGISSFSSYSSNNLSSSTEATRSTKPKEVFITQGAAASHLMAPQVKVVDGKIVVDTEFVPLPSSQKREEIRLDLVNADEEKHLTSHAFVRHSGTNRWSRDQTIEFYRAIQMCGTDFSQMTVLFSNRTREQLKAKFRLEERTDPIRLNNALKGKIPFDREWMNRIGKNMNIKEEFRKRGRPIGTNTF